MTTLGMGAAEMAEIAAIIKRVLAATTPTTITSGRQAGEERRARYDLPAPAIDAARARVRVLLDHYPLYPELDLGRLVARRRRGGEDGFTTAFVSWGPPPMNLAAGGRALRWSRPELGVGLVYRSPAQRWTVGPAAQPQSRRRRARPDQIRHRAHGGVRSRTWTS
jgi:hypothetical protein